MLMVIQAANNIPAFMEPEIPSHSSENPATGPFSESVESFPRLQILFIGDLF
jgi:hypothetical protein